MAEILWISNANSRDCHVDCCKLPVSYTHVRLGVPFPTMTQTLNVSQALCGLRSPVMSDRMQTLFLIGIYGWHPPSGEALYKRNTCLRMGKQASWSLHMVIQMSPTTARWEHSSSKHSILTCQALPAKLACDADNAMSLRSAMSKQEGSLSVNRRACNTGVWYFRGLTLCCSTSTAKWLPDVLGLSTTCNAVLLPGFRDCATSPISSFAHWHTCWRRALLKSWLRDLDCTLGKQ